MNESCEACALGPTKVDGHAALTVHSMAAAGMLFKCRRCELTWMRSYSIDGLFNWTRLPAHKAPADCVGIVLPSAGTRPAAVGAVADVAIDNVGHWPALQHSWKRPLRVPH